MVSKGVRKHWISVSVAAMIVLALSLCFAVPTKKAKAEEAFDPYSVEDKCAALSDTEILEGAEPVDGELPTVEDYINDLQSGGFVTMDSSGSKRHSDWLYRIIPIELFTNECTYFHNGRTYSYYIYTFGYTIDYPCASEVFFIYHAPGYDEKKGNVSLTVKVFQNGYVTGPWELGGETRTQYGMFGTSDYYLKDLQFYVGTQNEYAPNYGDAGYDKKSDDGVVLLQTRVNYKQMMSKTESGDFLPLVENIFDTVVGNIPAVSNIYNVYKGIKDVQSWISSFVDCIPTDSVTITEANNEIEIFDYDSKEAQADDKELPYYIRFATPVSRARDLLINDYAQIIARVSGTSPAARVYVGAFFNIYVKSTTGEHLMLLSDGTTKPYAVTSDMSNEEYRTEYPPINIHDERVLFDNAIATAVEGDNDGYLLAENSEQVFEFVPTRKGRYIVSNTKNNAIIIRKENDSQYVADEISNANIGEHYYIYVKPQSLDGLGAYKLNIEFAPPPVSVGQAVSKTVAAHSSEYFSFTAPKTDVYTFTCDDINAFGLRVEQIGGTELGSGVGHVALRLSANTKCYIRLSNEETNPKTAVFSVAPAPSLTLSSDFTFMRSTVVRFAPPVSGDYKLDVSSVRDDLRITVRYPDYSVKYQITGGGQTVEYYEAGEYFIEIECGASSDPYSLSVELVPFDITSRQTRIDVYHEYTVCRFVPNANGKYEFALDGTKLSLYDRNGEDVTDMLLVAGNGYYIAVSQSGTVTISLETDGSIALAEPYSAKAGNNVLAFTAQENGDYVFAGSGELVVLDDEYGLVTSGKIFGLSSGKTYYLVYTADIAENVILHLTADKLANYGSIIVTGSGLYELDVDEPADYTISVATWTGIPVPIAIYDVGMSMIEQSDDGRIVRTLAAGIYFVRVTTEPRNDLVISVHNSAQDGNVLQCVENKTYTIDLPENGSVIYKWDRRGKARSAGRLNTNIVGVDLQYTNIEIYRSINGEKSPVEFTNKAIGDYEWALDADIYFIEFISHRVDTLIFSVECFDILGEVTVFEKGVEIPACMSRGVLAVNRTYNISIAVDLPQYFSATVSMSAPTGVVLNAAASTVTLPADINLAGRKIILTFGVDKTDETKTVTFTIIKPYVATTSIVNDKFYVTVKDYLGNSVNASKRTIKISYIDGSVVTALSNNADEYDISALPVLKNVTMRAEITYSDPSYSERIEHVQPESNNIIRHDLIDESVDDSLEIIVSSNHKSLTVRGASDKTFKSFSVRADGRDKPFVINLIDFKALSGGISYTGSGLLTVNIYGSVRLQATSNEAHAISAKNIHIIGKRGNDTLTLKGGGNYTNGYVRTYAGSGLKAENVTIENLTVTSTGGDGKVSPSATRGAGVYGGNGIHAKNLTLKNSNITAYGGNGGTAPMGYDGAKGEEKTNSGNGGDGGPGGRGGDGGYGIYIDGGAYVADNTCTVNIYGGEGGNGGTGGRGGDGWNSTVNGVKGGNGGQGGRGGTYGKGGEACNISISANTVQKGVTGYGGQGGRGGKGGNGGKNANGGNGGNGGDSYFFGVRASGGMCGDGGVGGKMGNFGLSGAYHPYSFYTGSNTFEYTFVTYNPGTITVKAALQTGKIDITIRNPWGSTANSASGSGTVSTSFYASPGTKYRIILTPQSYVQYSLTVS